MRENIVVLGSGGHAKVVIDVIRSTGTFNVAGCVAQSRESEIEGVPILGDDSVLPSLLESGIKHAAVAIGENKLRLRLGQEIEALGLDLPPLVSGRAYVAASASVGAGTVVMPNAVVHPFARVGRLCVVNTTAIVEHDCRLGDGVHIAPRSVLCGSVSVGDRSFVGAGSTVIPNVQIGRDVLLGAGSVVIRDCVSPGTYLGAPARLNLKTQRA
jgi:UDP-perosamine 4-acetyltransferase